MSTRAFGQSCLVSQSLLRLEEAPKVIVQLLALGVTSPYPSKSTLSIIGFKHPLSKRSHVLVQIRDG